MSDIRNLKLFPPIFACDSHDSWNPHRIDQSQTLELYVLFWLLTSTNRWRLAKTIQVTDALGHLTRL